MKIITTGDWHLGNLFHGHDRMPEHRHFLDWLLLQLVEHRPDALLIAGDVFDNGNPSAVAQRAYYDFLAEATSRCPQMQVIITAGNHDSASRLEAPRPMLSRHGVEIRGSVVRYWKPDADDGNGAWCIDYDDLMIRLNDQWGVLAVPYLRSDVVQGKSYSEGVNAFLKTLTANARQRFPELRWVMMAHMYATGADIAQSDASEKIVIGGQEQVDMEGWSDHPDYMTCGHIHKRQHIWNTDWARYTGSVLPMSFAEKDYTHGVDLVTLDEGGKVGVEQLVYHPQHALLELPADDADVEEVRDGVRRWSAAKLKRLLQKTLADKVGEKPGDDFQYVALKLKMEKPDSALMHELEQILEAKNVVLCKIQRVIEDIDVSTMTGQMQITSVDEILNRDPMETLRECFYLKHKSEMGTELENKLRALLTDIRSESCE